MATTTTNYGFDIPQSTDLVKDGATAIATLGQDIDTAMNTALGTKKAGMVLLNTTSFSGVTQQAVPSVFSATYDSYMVTIRLQANPTADAIGYLKLRSGATDASGADYYYGARGLTSGGVASDINGGAVTTGWRWTTLDSGTGGFYSATMFIHAPFLALPTTVNYLGTGVLQDASAFVFYSGGGNHTVGASYDGINFIASAGNIAGSISVFGINK